MFCHSRFKPIAAVVLIVNVCAAAPFSSHHNLVVMRCTNDINAEKIDLDEYDVSVTPPVLLQTMELPSTGADAVTMPGLTNHDRHIHRSIDGRFLTFAGYHANYGALDPSGDPAAMVPRIIGIVKYDGTVDLTTRLTDAYDATSIRGAVTTDGVNIWTCGDNASGATPTGGTRFATKGNSTTVDLSQVQDIHSAHTPDNIRDINIFGGQLYNSSGSNTSVGKSAFRVGAGLPTSGSQTLTQLFTFSSSTSSFIMLDADPSTPGFDTLYVASSAPVGLHKFNLVGGVWTFNSSIASNSDVEEVTARLNFDGTATVFVRVGATTLYRFVDPQPYGGHLPSVFGDSYLNAPDGFTLGGIDFAPVVPLDFDLDRDVDNAGASSDLALMRGCVTGPGIPYDPQHLPAGCHLTPDAAGFLPADVDRDGDVDQDDFGAFQRCVKTANAPMIYGCYAY